MPHANYGATVFIRTSSCTRNEVYYRAQTCDCDTFGQDENTNMSVAGVRGGENERGVAICDSIALSPSESDCPSYAVGVYVHWGHKSERTNWQRNCSGQEGGEVCYRMH